MSIVFGKADIASGQEMQAPPPKRKTGIVHLENLPKYIYIWYQFV